MITKTTRPPASPAIAPADPPALDDLRTLVTVARTDRTDYGQRQVYFWLDDGPRTMLLYGQSVTIELQPGTHELRAHNTLFRKRIVFHVEAGEHLEFDLVNFSPVWLPAVVGLFGAAPLFLKIRRRSLT